jgi:SAM-dependent methyltransferase
MKDAAIMALDPRPGLKVLDLGSADGAQMVYCALMGADIAGQDLDQTSVAVANAKLETLSVAGGAVVGDATALHFGDNSFDAVISSDFHEHLTDGQQDAVLREAWRVLKPGGRLVVKTPNLWYLRIALLFKRCHELLARRNPLSVVIPHTPGTDDPQHVGLVSRPLLARQLSEAGFGQVHFIYTPLRRGRISFIVDVLSAEVPFVRDGLCEAVMCIARKPIASAYFPD